MPKNGKSKKAKKRVLAGIIEEAIMAHVVPPAGAGDDAKVQLAESLRAKDDEDDGADRGHAGLGSDHGHHRGFAFCDALRVGKGFRLDDVDPQSTPGYGGNKISGAVDLAEGMPEMSDLQERLFANGRDGKGPAVLLLVQGMDTSGKGGVMRHVVGATDPAGVKHTAFKAPTKEELSHDFLWRIEKALPGPGQLGVFDRSQYEDVLVVRVHDLVPREEWMSRYAKINAFERAAARRGITVIKVMLHISKDEQKARLMQRLERPDKLYKYRPGDLDDRAQWDAFMEAYQALLTKTSTTTAPWYVVPANRKWYARLAVQQILLEHLRALDLQWPVADFDVEAEKKRVAMS